VSCPCNLGCDRCGGGVLVLRLLSLVKKLIELSECVGNPEETTLLGDPFPVRIALLSSDFLF